MADERRAPPLGQRLRTGMRTYRFALSAVVFAVGILLTALALMEFLGPLSTNPVLLPINKVTDPADNGGTGPNYDLAFAVLGPIIFIVGAYLIGAYLVARRTFDHLMETKSKAEFLRNIPELEQVLWDLTPNDERRYFDKRAELKIRR